MNVRRENILIVGSDAMMMFKFHGALIRYLVTQNRKVTVAFPHSDNSGTYAAKLRALGARTMLIALSRNGLNPIADLRTFFTLVKLMRQLPLDVVLLYTAKPVIYGLFAAKVAKVPRRIALITGLGYAFTGKAVGRRRFIQYFIARLYQAALRFASVVLFQNKDDEQAMRRIGLIREEARSHVVDGCGVDTTYYAPSEVTSGPQSFLMISRVIADKGVREFVEAARIVRQAHPEVQFRLVGGLDSNPDAILRSEVESWVSDGSILWEGQVSDVRQVLAECSVFVLPSYREGLPQSTIEALASGRPVITTDVPGCRETVIEGETGLLVPPGSGADLADACRQFINNPEIVFNWGRSARKVAEQRFCASRINLIMTRYIDE